MSNKAVNFVNTSSRSEEQNACRPRITRPRYDHCDTDAKQEQRLKLILPWINSAMEYAPHAARNPEAFVNLAIAHGYPAVTGDRETIRKHGEDLLAIWRRLSPAIADQAEGWTSTSAARKEDFTPGLMYRMRKAIERIRPTLGRAVLVDRSVLDDPFAFIRLCRKHGYDGPGAGHELKIQNDVNRKMGEKLIAAFKLVILG